MLFGFAVKLLYTAPLSTSLKRDDKSISRRFVSSSNQAMVSYSAKTLKKINIIRPEYLDSMNSLVNIKSISAFNQPGWLSQIYKVCSRKQ